MLYLVPLVVLSTTLLTLTSAKSLAQSLTEPPQATATAATAQLEPVNAAQPSGSKATLLPPVAIEPLQQSTATGKKSAGGTSAAEPSPANESISGGSPSSGGDVPATSLASLLASSSLSKTQITALRPVTSDTASLLRSVPGISLYTGGGVSSLPGIRGLNDDRIKVVVNSMTITSACANHMNTPLSYADPSLIGAIEVAPGITPVSTGGDSIAGTIVVEAAPPEFTAIGEGVATHGRISAFARSNGDSIGGSVLASTATTNVSITYAGSWTRAENYEDGDGNEAQSTLYQAQNQTLTLAARNGDDLLVVQGGLNYIPYQGFVNQRMDMVENDGQFVNARYATSFDWGRLDTHAFYQHTQHEMNFLDDKKFSRTPPRNMPMRTDGQDFGYTVKAEIPVTLRDMVRIGSEFHRQTLDDWWPPVPGMMMMCCEEYQTINDGHRDRLGTFVEWEAKWTPQWTTLVGIRNDVVWMNTADVSGYNMLYATDAALFNSRDHARTDVNFDATALARYEPDATTALEFGYARKTRSPNLYERYAWSTVDEPMDMAGQMAVNMIGWFGDGNGYTGNLNLKPEVAHTLSVTAGWLDWARRDWQLKVTPYYTYVVDYIGVAKLSNQAGGQGYVNLRFVNHDAELYGVDVSAAKTLIEDPAYGRFALRGIVGYVHAENADTGDNLYHIMPLNARVGLEHAFGHWTSAIEFQLVSRKDEVDPIRNELPTPGYALVNLRTAYQWERMRVDLGIENLFDEDYELPLGGINVGPTLAPLNGARENVPGAGRSFYAGLTIDF